MIYVLKLKPSKDFTGLLPAFFCIFISGITAAVFGRYEAYKIMGSIVLFYSIFSFIAFYRTKCIGYLVSTLYMIFMGLYFLSLNVNDRFGHVVNQTTASKVFMIVDLALFALLLYLLFTKRIKWRGREIFELSAINVDENSNTYTDRPRPVGRLEYKKDEVLNFASFLMRNLIVMPYYEQERTLLVVVKMGDEYGHLFKTNVNYWDKTWIAFDFDGNISAHISKKDYLDYKYNLEFDNLTEALGNLFIDFFNNFRNGEELRIIDKLNEAKVGIYV
ncbi:MAG: hypothetical protein C0412_11885 [Flavobacterium sp.]|nr:hypothetical protein [Flavobacterium sp.]